MPDSHKKFHSSGGKRLLLLVEDNPDSLHTMITSLEEHYKLLTAESAGEAYELIEKNKEILSLVLADQTLPDFSGMELLQMIRKNPELRWLPVIITCSDTALEAECLTGGATDFIPKPYPSENVLQARVLRSIELSEIRETLNWTERDHLTGLFNREYFYHYAVQFDHHHKQMEMDAVLVDINYFHAINDRYGRVFGDRIIRELGRLLYQMVMPDDHMGMVGRRHADTFLIYWPHRDGYEDYLKQIALPLNQIAKTRIQLRVGVYSCVDKSLDIEQRFHRAKKAADTVKTSYLGGVAFYDNTMHESEIFSLHLLEGVTEALKEKQFLVYYQPKFDIRHEEPLLNSAEALVRWNHPEYGMISPGRFIPILERNGLIRELDNYVWREVVSRMREWKERYGRTLPVSVNVSRIDMYDSDLLTALLDLTEEYGIRPGELLLEITESAYTQNSKPIIENVKKLQQAGFLIEMDDFGSGYSSLNMISEMPVDVIKLDMQFIQSAFRENHDTRVVEAAIRIAESLYVPTVAEGVETEEQLIALKAMGCDIAQGYYFSKPLPVEAYEVFIEKRMKTDVSFNPIELSHGGPCLTDRQVRRMSLYDSLTGLYNYSAFELLIRDADRYHTALLIAYVNEVRSILHSQGERIVDELLRSVTALLRQYFRTGDQICRISTYEFAVIMTRVDSSIQSQVIEKINRINEALLLGDGEIPPASLSVGVAFADRKHPEGDVFMDADTALTRQKEKGRPGCEIF